MRLALATHPSCADHQPFPGHPERPERLGAAIAGGKLAGAEEISVPFDADDVLAAVARVHSPALADRLREACRGAPAVFDSEDNPISAGTFTAAAAAVAASLAAVRAAVAGDWMRVWVPVRPPGHHALSDKAMGFCFFNNVAIAAEEVVARGAGPVAIVDFDAHHGNGTQAHFWGRANVFYFSLHGYPMYPGSGVPLECGEGEGAGTTLNVPLAPGFGDETFCEAMCLGIGEIRRRFEPACWLVSAGFDAHHRDPIGGLAVTEQGFAVAGGLLDEAAGRRPIVAVLEGGYELEALRSSVQSFLLGLIGAVAP